MPSFIYSIFFFFFFLFVCLFVCLDIILGCVCVHEYTSARVCVCVCARARVCVCVCVCVFKVRVSFFVLYEICRCSGSKPTANSLGMKHSAALCHVVLSFV